MRVALSLVALAAFFAAAVLGGGQLIGVWDDLTLPPAARAAADRAVQTLTPSAARKTAASKSRRRVERMAKARRADAVRWAGAANRRCRSARAETLARIGSPRTLAEAEATLSRLADLNRRYNAQVLAIPRPAGGRERAKIARLSRLLGSEDAVLASLLEAVRDCDPTRILTLNDRLVALAERETALLVELGATDCAS